MESPLGQIDVNPLDPGQGDVGHVHDHHLGPGVPGQLGGRRTHAGRPAHHQDTLVVVAECVEHHHPLPPPVAAVRRRHHAP